MRNRNNRFLRSKRLRAALWRHAEGLCQQCGNPLPPIWHADHTQPFCDTGRTNVHEMQALCPSCNTRKGARHAAPPSGRTQFPV
jgi:5-methylcytosine-specific restriction endonuclease McrA